ncbi:MAG: hypothetical protein ACTSUP_09760 [Candidatus Heimdallarchaeaceae archaeon]
MSINLLQLIPEKFQDSDLLTALVDVISIKLVNTTNSSILIIGTIVSSIDSDDLSITLKVKDSPLPTSDQDFKLLIWDPSYPSPSEDPNYEIVEATYSTGDVDESTYTIIRGKERTSASTHDVGSYTAIYKVLSIDEMIEKISFFQQLQDPYNVPEDYLQHLADHIGFILSSGDDVSTSVRRKELLGAVDWYKMKGTYQSLGLISLWASFNFTIYDKYCNSEANYNNGVFSDQEWFVGNEDENPTGLGSSYFKSPHFGLNIDLDRIYDAGVYVEGLLDRHLWRPSLFVGIEDHVEKTRPVNTVPSYLILHTCITDESLLAFTITTTDVITRIVGNWSYNQIRFDETRDESGASEDYHFDDDIHFDVDIEDFIASISVWKLSTCEEEITSGDDELNPCMVLTGDTPAGGFALDNVVLSGTIDSYKIYANRIEFYFTVPKSVVQYDINEIGLYRVVNDVEELMIVSTCPEINKGDDIALKVKVIVYRTTEEEEYSPAEGECNPVNYGDCVYSAGVYGGT